MPLTFTNIVNFEIKERPHLCDVTFIDYAFSKKLKELTIKFVMMWRNISQRG